MGLRNGIAAGLLATGLSLCLAACGSPDGQAGTDASPEEIDVMRPSEAAEDEPGGIPWTTEDPKASDGDQGDFYVSEVTDDIFDRMRGKSFKDDCTLPREDLRYLHVLHRDVRGETHEGEMIVNAHIADDMLDILEGLYEAGYPIEKIRLVDEYGADDEASMEDNNSSCFNFRLIPYTSRVSKHGLGLAVDINTLYNPYTKIVDGRRIIQPATGEPYLDRDAEFDYKIDRGDPCHRLFTEHGFEWGGDWDGVKDWQHFEVPDWQIAEWYPGWS